MPNPDAKCESCQPGNRTHDWSQQSDGTLCAPNGVCRSGACTNGCWIESTYHTADTRSPTKACRTCQPAASRTDWSPVLASQCSPIAAGRPHSCAIVNGDVFCWGDNASGELGGGTTTASLVPVKVKGLEAKAWSIGGNGFDLHNSVNYGEHTCALLVTSAVKCWGSNNVGALGVGKQNTELPMSPSPMQPIGLTEKVASLTVGTMHVCALRDDAVYCWGHNIFGEIGDGTAGYWAMTMPKKATTGATMIGVGGSTSCAVANDSILFWGYNGTGQFGNGKVLRAEQPTFTLMVGLDAGL